MNTRLAAMAAVWGASLLSGCASVTDGTTQTIAFTITPKETQCTLSRDGGGIGSINGIQNTVTISKSVQDIFVNCSAEGYKNQSHRIASATQTSGIIGGSLLDLGLTDMLTGAMWKYPAVVSIVMEKKPEVRPVARTY